MTKFSGAGLGWTFETELEDATRAPAASGFALRKVRHDNYNFAEDIRLVGVWLTLEHYLPGHKLVSVEKKFLVVGAPTFQASAVRTIDPKAPTSATRSGISRTFDYLKNGLSGLKYADYFEKGGNYAAYGVAADFDAPDLFSVLGVANCEQTGLSIQQTMLLSRYGKDPPHEPSGTLDAARCHPMVAYKLTVNPACDYSKTYVRVASLRFDFRLHLTLDYTLREKTIPSAGGGNKAGLFADSDIGSLRATGRLVSGGGIAGVAFSAAEKPLLLEVAAPGLIRGQSEGDLPGHKDVLCWDNIHWWGAGSQISSPGAFHAAHMHWRWGEILKSWAGHAPIVNAAWRRFNPGDALVDPRAHYQDINIAVTKYSQALDPMKTKPAKLTNETWSDLFHVKNHPEPAIIGGGADLVLWYSTEVNRFEAPASQEGAVFLHGAYFAHNAEPGTVSLAGTRDDIYGSGYADLGASRILSENRWFRAASN